MFSFETLVNGHNLADMALRFAVGRDASMTRNGFRASIIASQCQLLRSEAVEKKKQVTGRTIEVLVHVMWVYAECGGGRGHELAEADRTDMA
ncbi:hypothetical protein SY26_19080 [Paracoccus sp. 228]|nr:hypothetical protein SY26_19080 [Paracoccus sp. 228]